MDWLFKTGKWTLMTLPVVEWHDLELTIMTFKISNFVELCVTTGKRHHDSGLSVCTTDQYEFLMRRSQGKFSSPLTATSNMTLKIQDSGRNSKCLCCISSDVRHGRHYRWLAHTRQTPASMSTFSGTINWNNLRPTPADVDRHRKCKAVACKPEVSLY